MTIKNGCSPVCKSSDILIINNQFEDLLFCKNCSLLQKKNLGEHKNKVLLFDKFNKNVSQVIKTDYYKKQISENKSILKKIINKTKKKPNKILDYGCGYGEFMFAAMELGSLASGYDINRNFTESLANYFKTYKSEKDLLDKDNFKKYDLVFCRKVLTLSSNIYKDFCNFNDLLSSEGYLVIMDQVKNFSKYKSMITQNDTNNSLLLTVETLKFYADVFNFETHYMKNDFGDVLIIFKRKTKNYKNKRISINTLKNLERLSFVFLFLSKIKRSIQKIYYWLKN